MTRAQLISAVALRMDEITPSAGLSVTVDGSDNNPLATLIDGIIDDGVLELYSVAPFWRLSQTAFVYSPVPSQTEIAIARIDGLDSNSRKIIRIKVPEDFLRIAQIDCPGFQRPITEVFTEQSAEGRRQHNRYLMGKEAKPVAVMAFSNAFPGTVESCREIQCYSLAADSTAAASNVNASYIAKPAVISDTATPAVAVEDVVPAPLIGALEWLVAARAFGARGDLNHANICQQNAQNLLM